MTQGDEEYELVWDPASKHTPQDVLRLHQTGQRLGDGYAGVVMLHGCPGIRVHRDILAAAQHAVLPLEHRPTEAGLGIVSKFTVRIVNLPRNLSKTTAEEILDNVGIHIVAE